MVFNSVTDPPPLRDTPLTLGKKKDPFVKPPEYEALVGDLKGSYSRRIHIQHRIVYQAYEKEKVVKIIRMWTHYGE